MNHKEIQQLVWNEGKANIANGRDAFATEPATLLKNVFNKYCNSSYWKNPFTAVNVPDYEIEWLKAGIEWYHGCEAVVIGNTVSSIGYVC